METCRGQTFIILTDLRDSLSRIGFNIKTDVDLNGFVRSLSWFYGDSFFRRCWIELKDAQICLDFKDGEQYFNLADPNYKRDIIFFLRGKVREIELAHGLDG